MTRVSPARAYVVTHPHVLHCVAAVLTTEWLTAPEIAKLAHVRRDFAQAACADLAQAAAAEHAVGPEGRSPRARCWRRPPAAPDSAKVRNRDKPERDESRIESPKVTRPAPPPPIEGLLARGLRVPNQAEEPRVRSHDKQVLTWKDWAHARGPSTWWQW